MKFYSIINVVVLVIIMADNIRAQVGPVGPGAPNVECVDGMQPVMVGDYLKCLGATINECYGVVCLPNNKCRSQTEIWLTNECCPRCKEPINNCSNVYCYSPTRFCKLHEVPIPQGSCCPVCVKITL